MNDDPGLLDALERGQSAEATSMPLPRRKLGRGTQLLLALMRLYVMMAIPLVFYAFFRALQKG